MSDDKRPLAAVERCAAATLYVVAPEHNVSPMNTSRRLVCRPLKSCRSLEKKRKGGIKVYSPFCCTYPKGHTFKVFFQPLLKLFSDEKHYLELLGTFEMFIVHAVTRLEAKTECLLEVEPYLPSFSHPYSPERCLYVIPGCIKLWTEIV